MAGCWTSLEETHQLDKISLRDGMQLMLQHERDMRTSNRIARLIKNAGFRLKATLEELETDTTRGISSTDVADVASGSYIRDGRTIIINGPTGTGKSYLACALGEHACRQGVKTLYFTMNMLIEQLKLVHLEGRETNFFRKLSAQPQLENNYNLTENEKDTNWSNAVATIQLPRFTLTWSHYLILMRIENIEARSFYEIEAAQQQWSVSVLSRQVGKRVNHLRDRDNLFSITSPLDLCRLARPRTPSTLVQNAVTQLRSYAVA